MCVHCDVYDLSEAQIIETIEMLEGYVNVVHGGNWGATEDTRHFHELVLQLIKHVHGTPTSI